MPPSEHLILLTYTPRANVEARGYDDWVREIDNPFFNAVPGIVHYTSWKIANTLVGDVPFTHLDLMFVDGPDGFERVFGRQDVIDFARGWCDQWGATPGADDLAASNAEMHLLGQLAASPGPWRRTDTLIATFSSPHGDADAHAAWGRDAVERVTGRPGVAHVSGWRLAAAKVGEAAFTDLSLLFTHDVGSLAGLAADPGLREVADRWLARWGPGGDAGIATSLPTVLCELIAAPD